MITCRTATERLVAHWSAPASQHNTTDSQPELQAAIEHVHHCPRCEERLGFLVRTLSADVRDTLTCVECEALLPEYVQAEQSGREGEARWERVAAHLASCPHCAEARAALEVLLDLAYGAPGGRPERAPAPDVAFLPPSPRETPAPRETPLWRLDELGRLIVELTDHVLGSLLPQARPAAHALAGLKSAAPGTLFELPIQVPDADLNVTIQAEGERAAPERCTLCVLVDIPSRGGWPNLAGTEVTLKQAGNAPSLAWTDAYGEAIFEGVPVENLAGLVIEIMPGE
jgi:hypothetical protein